MIELAKLLKINREQHGYMQEQLAEQLFVSHQSISKWERGINLPRIDNLLLLSDLYNISLDKLIRGSNYFKKPYVIGNKMTRKKGIFFLLIWLLISLFFTGFGYQPWWLFLFLFLIIGPLIFSVFIEDYWMITRSGITFYQYPQKGVRKIASVLSISLGNLDKANEIVYSEIHSLTLVYKKRQRYSPFDTNPDDFYLLIEKKTGEKTSFR